MPSTLNIIQQRRHRRDKTRSSGQQRSQRMVLGFGFVVSAVLVVLVLVATLTYASLTHGLPPVEELYVLLNPLDGLLLQPTRLYDRTGVHLVATLAPTDTTRTYIPLSSFPQAFVDATLALSDPGFWTSPGYVIGGWQDTSNHPTLAQNLVSNLLLWDVPASPVRGIHERMLAAQVTAQYGRQQVLEWTLNSTDYGHFAYGAEAAAQLYFGKSVSELDLSEGVMLAAVGQAPALNPIDAPVLAEQHREMTLLVMQAMGFLSSEQVSQAIATPPLLVGNANGGTTGIAPAFVKGVLSQLDGRYGEQRVERGGLVILTSLDYDLQLQSLCTVQTYLNRLAGVNTDIPAADGSDCNAARLLPALQEGGPISAATASVTILDPQAGQILAEVGDVNGGNQSALLVNHPAGTSITPFIYLSGFTRGLNPASLGWDIPIGLPASGQVYHGPVRLRIAMANDYLPPGQSILAQMGTESVRSVAVPFGLDLPAGLLTNEFDISPLALAAAYGIFANDGIQVGQGAGSQGLHPSAVLQINGVDHSTWSDWTILQSQSVVSPQLAYLMNQVLSDETSRWPSLGHPNSLEIGRPAGVKLSRTLNSSAGWTVGYTPQRSIAVWLGAGGSSVSPSRSADLWHALMQYAVIALPSKSWTMPTGVVTLTVCDPSGLLPSPACPNIVNEVFLDGRQPLEIDTLYQTFKVNRETGLFATIFTPPELVENNTYMVVPAQARVWALAAGISTPPTAYDTMQTPPVNADVHISTPEMFSVERGKIDIHGTAAGLGFTSYRLEYGQGLYPSAWFQIGSDGSTQISEGTLGLWDTSGLNGLYALRLMVVHHDQRVEQAVVQVTLDNTPPQVAITYPQAGQVLNISQEPKVALQAQINEAFLSKVEFYVDTKRVGTSEISPFGVIWQAGRGTHILRVVAIDQAGNTAEATISFTVK